MASEGTILDLICHHRKNVIKQLYEYNHNVHGPVFQSQLTVEGYEGPDDKLFCDITKDQAETMAKKLDKVGSKLQSLYLELLIKIATLNKFEVKLIAENLNRSSFSDEEFVILMEFDLHRYLLDNVNKLQVYKEQAKLVMELYGPHAGMPISAYYINNTDLSTYPQLHVSHPFSVLVRTLENSRLVNGLIKFKSAFQHTEFPLPPCGIMVRECYPRLKDLMLTNSGKSIHLGGTPGTGKSAFMCYLLFCVIHAHDNDWLKDSPERDYHSVLFDTGSSDLTDRYFLWRRGKPILSIVYSIPLVCLNKPGVLQLAECGTKRSPLVISNTITVIAASPSKFDQSNIHKVYGLKSYFMPVWSLQELLACLQNIYNVTSQEKIAMLKKLYNVYGGVPSSVINKGVMAIESDSALEKYIDTFKKPVRIEKDPHLIIAMVDVNGELYHSLVHLAVDDDTFEKTGVVFASREIADLVVEVSLKRSGLGMIEFLEDSLSTSYVWVTTTEPFFKKGAMKLIADGGEFYSDRAFYTNTASNETSQPFVTRFSAFTQIIRYESLEEVEKMLTDPSQSIDEHILFVPESLINPTFDAFSFPNNVFQFTVREKHDCKPSPIFQQLMNLMRYYSQSKTKQSINSIQSQANPDQMLNFYWVLPGTEVFDRFAINLNNKIKPEQRQIQDKMNEQLVHIKLKIDLSTGNVPKRKKRDSTTQWYF